MWAVLGGESGHNLELRGGGQQLLLQASSQSGEGVTTATAKATTSKATAGAIRKL
jgi:hypothetical protein